MARINIEDSIYQDPRFMNLIIKTGSRFVAIGMMVCAWSLAQRHYLKTNNRSIPFNEWERGGLSILEGVGLAVRHQDGVYVCGSEKQFSWLLQRSKAGQKSSQARKTKGKRTTVESRSVPLNGRERVATSSSYSSSYSSSPSSSPSNSTSNSSLNSTTAQGAQQPAKDPPLTPPQEVSQGGADAPDPARLEDRLACQAQPLVGVSPFRDRCKETWAAYASAYLEVWKQAPVRNAAVNAQITQLVKRLGQDAPDVISFYVHHRDSFYVKNCHPVGLCLKNAEGLHTQWQRREQITGATVRQLDSSQHYREQMSRLTRSENHDE